MQHSISSRRRKRIVFLVFVAVAIAIAIYILMYRGSAAKKEVTKLYDAVNLGDDRSRLHELANEFKMLTLRHVSESNWFFETPLQFGAGNWILVVNWTNDHVSAVRVRTADSLNSLPNSAPPDK